MRVVPRGRRRPALLCSVATAVAVAVPMALSPSVASAEDAVGGSVVGELVQAWVEPGHADGHHPDGSHDADGNHDADGSHEDVHDAPLTWVVPEDEEAVRVPSDDVARLPVGATVEVTLGGEVVDEATTEHGLDSARDVLDADVLEPAPAEPAPTAEAADTVTNEVTVVMMVPSNGVQQTGRTLDQVVGAVQGPVRDFWAAETGGAVALGVAGQVDWFQGTVDCSDPFALWDEAAARAGWVEGPGRHLLVYVPSGTPGCAYGLAEVGAAASSGGRMYVTDVAVSLVAHELGHNFGLGHSGARQCDGAVETGSCADDDYRDLYDVMGYSWGPVGSLHAAHAAELGVLPAEHRVDVSPTTAGSTYTLSPISGRTGTRALRLTDGRGAVYWLEYRSAAGRDGWLGTTTNSAGLQSGVLLRRELDHNFSSLLDGSPSPSTGWAGDYRTALPVGMPVAVAGGDLRITVRSVTDTAATVWIGTRAARVVGGNPSRPVGSLDAVTVDEWGSSLSVLGWGLDRDTPTDVLSTHVYVNGRGVALPAAANRPDVGRAYPGAGNAHGFAHTVAVSPGTHRVCAFAIDSAGSGSTLLGCRDVTVRPRPPIGSLDVVSSAGATVTVRGWALDRDTPADVLPVHLYIDGRGTAISASGDRPDVGRAFPPAGNAHGFAYSTQLPPGPHEVCAFAIDSAQVGNTLLGCRKLTVVPYLPIGSVDAVSVSGSTITVQGWTFDPDTPTAVNEAHVYIGTTGTALAANGDRPDVGRVFPAAGNAHGFGMSLAVPPGEHRVCVYGIDSAGAGSTLLGCRTVRV